MRGLRLGVVCTGLVVLAACSDAVDPLAAEYPPMPGDPQGSEPPGDDPAPSDPSKPDGEAPPPLDPPIAGKKIADGSIFMRGATTDGAIVFDQNLDLMVWPAGAASSIRLVQDYKTGEDSVIIKGRFVAAWLGQDPKPSSPTFWAQTGGVQTIATMQRDTLYAKASSDEFAYLTSSATADILHRDIWATKASGGAGSKIVPAIDMGLTAKQCRPTIAYSASDLVVAGCAGGSTTAKVVAYATDGSGATKTILDSSAPGMVINRARTHALVQTTTASSIHPLSGLGNPVAIDGAFRLASFSSDDSKVVYLSSDNKVKRASTTAPTSPVKLLDGAISILAMSPDARFVIAATKGDPSNNRSDVVLVDASNPTAAPPRVLVPQEGMLVGLSKDGSTAIYLGDAGTNFDPPLFVTTLPSGTPTKLADEITGMPFVSDDVVYWQELVKGSPTTPASNTLKAARIASPTVTITIEKNLDPLTSHLTIANAKLFVASKLGLWEYPLLKP